MNKIILASQSPRRKQLLEWAEIDFEVVVSETDESFPAGMSVSEAAIFIAKAKAKVIAINHTDRIVLAADTIVVIDNKIIGKPKNRANAIEILQKLEGKSHQVITGVSFMFKDQEVCFADITEVEFHPLSQAQIEFYIDKYKPYDKAGAYAIQEWIGVVGIKKINGDFYNVMGLPVSRVIQTLQLSFGF